MNERLLIYATIVAPFAGAVLIRLLGRRLGVVSKVVAVAVTAAVLAGATWAFAAFSGGEPAVLMTAPGWTGAGAGERVILAIDGLSAMVLLGVGFFSLLVTLYSAGFVKDGDISPGSYYANMLVTVGAVSATVLACDLVVLFVFWAFMGIPFFLLVNMGGKASETAAKKMLIVLGGTDGLMILGIALVYRISGSVSLLQESLPASRASTVACLCLVAAAFAKAGAMPFHSWVPDVAESAPVPVVAFLPASLDKLLGIYLFARVTLGLFEITPVMRGFFIIVGAATVMAAVMMALAQHNLRRLLGFHAVSQVGYMILGVATGTPIGVVGGLFHMVNHAVYKSCLFLTAGAVERRSGTQDLDRMGGLGRLMPVTFGAAVIAAMAISGVPPLNGFVSKWMVYQGIIEMGPQAGLWVVALVAAMFGSALTLASFIKVLHSVFLGQPQVEGGGEGPKPNFLMRLPMAVLAATCVLFGVFAFALPVKGLIIPALPGVAGGLESGVLASPSWMPVLATGLLLAALVVGVLIYIISRLRVREDEAYVGGETGANAEQFRFSGTEFYRTVTQLPVISRLFGRAEEGWFDVYEVGRRFVFYVAGVLQVFHGGLLLTYVAWCVAGVVILLWLLMGTV